MSTHQQFCLQGPATVCFSSARAQKVCLSASVINLLALLAKLYMCLEGCSLSEMSCLCSTDDIEESLQLIQEPTGVRLLVYSQEELELPTLLHVSRYCLFMSPQRSSSASSRTAN